MVCMDRWLLKQKLEVSDETEDTDNTNDSDKECTDAEVNQPRAKTKISVLK